MKTKEKKEVVKGFKISDVLFKALGPKKFLALSTSGFSGKAGADVFVLSGASKVFVVRPESGIPPQVAAAELVRGATHYSGDGKVWKKLA